MRFFLLLSLLFAGVPALAAEVVVPVQKEDDAPNQVFKVDLGPQAKACPDEMEWHVALALEKAMRAVPGCQMKFTARNAVTMEARNVLVKIASTNQSCRIIDEAADGVVHEPEGDIMPVLPPEGLVIYWDKDFAPGQAFFNAVKTGFQAAANNVLPLGVEKNVIIVEAGTGYPWKMDCKRK